MIELTTVLDPTDIEGSTHRYKYESWRDLIKAVEVGGEVHIDFTTKLIVSGEDLHNVTLYLDDIPNRQGRVIWRNPYALFILDNMFDLLGSSDD